MISEDFLFKLAMNAPGFLFAIVAHEWAHGYMALKFGDATAKQQGRLTLNPAVHVDPMGTVIWPLFLLLISGGSIAFGYAKPVPVNPIHFKNYRSGLFWVSFAGPLMNIILGILSAFLYVAMAYTIPPETGWTKPITQILFTSMQINFVLAVFNLIPWPPLDGSRMVSSFLDHDKASRYESLSRFSLLFLLVLWTTNIFSYLFAPAIFFQRILVQMFAALFA